MQSQKSKVTAIMQASCQQTAQTKLMHLESYLPQLQISVNIDIYIPRFLHEELTWPNINVIPTYRR